MMSRHFKVLLAVAAVVLAALTTTLATPIISQDMQVFSKREAHEPISEKLVNGDQNVIGTCLRIAPDLPPCNFDADATWRSRSGEILRGNPAVSGYPVSAVKEFIDDEIGEKIFPSAETADQKNADLISEGEKDIEEFEIYENDLGIMIVYYLEGCLPSRLPFDLPSCSIDELQTIQMNKLVPFKLPDVEDAVIFPEIDVKEIEFATHRQSRAPPDSKSHEETFDGEESTDEAWELYPRFSSSDDNGLIVQLEDIKTRAQGVQDFHKTMTKSNMNAKTGMASAKYTNEQQGSGLASISSSSAYPWGSEKNKIPVNRIGKIEVKLDEVMANIEDKIREVSDVLEKDKNRMQ